MSDSGLQTYLDNLLSDESDTVRNAPVSEPSQSLEALFAKAQAAPLPQAPEAGDVPIETAIPSLADRLAEQRFQSLLFSIVGVTFAIPLVELGGIHKVSKIQFLMGKPNWFAGMMDIQGRHVQIVDGAKWILADRYNDALAEQITAAGGYQYVILLADSNWGIACCAVQESISVSKEDVRWRSPQSKRPWLAGLMSSTMCAMLDSRQLVNMLDAGLLSTQK